jgi:hypothetical protein
MIDASSASGGSRIGLIAGGFVLVAGAAAAAFLIVPKYLHRSEASEAQPAVATAPTPPPAIAPPVETPPAPAETKPAEPTPTEVAPTPAPPPTEAAPPPTIVDIGFVTAPVGVTVYRVGETVALGVTPFTVPLPRSDKPVELRFEKAGYQPKTVEVPVEEDLEIEVSLSRQRDKVASSQGVKMRKTTTTPTPTEDKKPKKVQREGVIDPFANP